MPRLIDDLRANGARLVKPHFVPPAKEAAWAELAKRTHEVIMRPDLPVILIDNVAEYFYSSEQEYWDLSVHFPNLAPPFPAMWFEHRMPRTIHSKECGDTDVTAWIQHGRNGALIHGLAPEDCKAEGLPENVRWILWCELFIDYGVMRGVTAMGPHGSCFMCVDGEGKIIDRPWMQSLAETRDAEIMRNYMSFFHPAFLAISFLHCRNVTLVDNRPDRPLAKKYHARHGVMPCTWKTLVIEPLKKILRTEGRSDHVGIQRALHVCRGHFRDYREGRGLFGKYHQLVWQPAIVRGTKGTHAPPREIKIGPVPNAMIQNDT